MPKAGIYSGLAIIIARLSRSRWSLRRPLRILQTRRINTTAVKLTACCSLDRRIDTAHQMSSQQPRIPKKQRPTRERMPDHVPVPPAPPDLIYSRRQPPRVHQQRPAPGDAKRKRAARKRLPRTHRTLAVLLQAVRDEQLTFEMKDGTSVAGALLCGNQNFTARSC